MRTYLLTVFLLVVSINISKAQCYPDRHNTNWFDGWISCEAAQNPNTAYGESHWILYDFNSDYELGQMHVWNANDPSHLDYGMQTVSIDYSVDGMDWVNLGTFEFEQATGKSIYEGFEGPDFEGVVARYVLITGISNFGGECYGLSEIRIAVQPVTVSTNDLVFDLDCKGSDKGIVLEWTYNGTMEGTRFMVEKSDDTETWQVIETTDAYTLPEGNHKFRFIDGNNIDGAGYYRLIEQGIDGQLEYSNVHYCTDQQLDARIFPNPMVSFAKLEIFTNSSEPVLVRINDVFGRKLYEQVVEPVSISTGIDLQDLSFNEGQYFVTLRQGAREKALKLIKM